MPADFAPQIVTGQVMHRRTRPLVNAFVYPVFYVRLPLRRLEACRCAVFSIDRPNVLSFYRADHGARDMLRKGRRSGPAAIVGHPFWRFFRAYALRRGFLDGTHGLVAALLDGFTTYLKYARLWELRRRGAAADAGEGR